MDKYSINIMWSDEDGGYIATIPEFPGLSAFGESPEEAIGEAKIALTGFIEVYNEDECKLPEPQIMECFSGQTRLRLPKNLHAKLSQQAKREGVSLNTYLVQLLSEGHVKNQIGRQLNDIKQLALLNNAHRVKRSPGSHDMIRPLIKSTWGEETGMKIRIN